MTVTASIVKAGIARSYGVLASYLTIGNGYVDVGVVDTGAFKTVKFRFTATTNNLKVTILGSLDGGVTYPEDAEAEFTITAGTPVLKTITSYWTHLKAEVKPAGAGAHGTLATWWAGVSV